MEIERIPDSLSGEMERCHEASFSWSLACCGRDPIEAEDVLQTVYLKILTGKARYRGDAAFKTWIFGVIRKTAIDSLRRKVLRRLRLKNYVEKMPPQEPARNGYDLEAETQTRKLFLEGLARLPKRQAEVLHLVFYQDLTLREAAEVMGTSLGSARTHYARGKKKLGQWMIQSKIIKEYEWPEKSYQGSFS